jgi:hypothetical protein
LKSCDLTGVIDDRQVQITTNGAAAADCHLARAPLAALFQVLSRIDIDRYARCHLARLKPRRVRFLGNILSVVALLATAGHLSCVQKGTQG